jgi:hypothetical protein
MRRRILIFFLGGFCMLSTDYLLAQSGTLTGGGEAAGTGGSVSYSVGQIQYETVDASTGTITEGLQQPYEIFVVTGVEEKEITLNVSLYPNPAESMIILDARNAGSVKMNYVLFDSEGRSLAQNSLVNEKTEISLERMASGVYYLKVFNNKKEIKVFKIIKNG